jgi:predicted kinase
MEVLVFCGLQASGKSTYYHEYFSLTHLLISKDLMGQTRYKEQHQRELLHLALQARHCVVIDNTNPTPLVRASLIEIAHNYGAIVIGYSFATSLKQAIERNQQREGAAKVPPVAIYSTAARLIQPTYAEGFDRLYYVQISANSTPTAPTWVVEEVEHV